MTIHNRLVILDVIDGQVILNDVNCLFESSVNVIYEPSGSGKTRILKIIGR